MEQLIQSFGLARLIAAVVVGLLAIFVVIVPALWDATKPRFQIGLGNRLEHVAQSHGFVWVQSKDGGQASKPFTIDQPRVLERPSRRVRKALVAQIEAMGLIPTHIEIVLEGQRRVYKTSSPVPKLVFAG